MKSIRFVLAAVMAIAASVHAQVADATDSPESVAAQVASPATACILGDLPDGTPPPPQPQQPVFRVPVKDILATTTHQQGGRSITIRRIKPIALPLPPEPPPVLATLPEDPAELGVPRPKWDFLFLGATVYRSKDSPPRTLVSFWPSGRGEPVRLWSSADFGLLSGFADFAAADGHRFSLLMMWGYEDIDRMADLHASHNLLYEAPVIPDFPDGKAIFTLVGNPPDDPEILVPIQALHDIYNNEFARLKAAYDGRERARLQREAELKANPPRPKNITLNYWRTERPAPAKGGAK